MNQHHIVFLAVDRVQATDLFGPLDAFDAARQMAGADYSLVIAGFEHGQVVTESGVRLVADGRLDEFAGMDTLMICGGRGARDETVPPARIDALREAVTRAERVVSICTGAFLLARTGLLRERRVTTHWRHAGELARRHPDLDVDADSIFVRDGKFWSSAGVTAGIDLSLALIGEDFGAPAAAAVARQLVVYLRRPGNQAQYSDALLAQFRTSDRFADLVEWITNNLSRPMSVEHLAERAGFTPRHFTRLCKQAFGLPPGRLVENIRLDRARALLGEKDARVDQVADRVGFRSAAAFRRAFERRFSMSPSQFRARFDTSTHTRKTS